MAPTVVPKSSIRDFWRALWPKSASSAATKRILARQNGFLELHKVAPALFQRRRTIAQEGSALKRKRGVQGAICLHELSLFCLWRSLGHPLVKVDPLDTVQI